jgi:hypothetical protein
VAESPSFRILDENAEATLTARRETQEEESSEEESSVGILGDRQSKVYYSKACPPAGEIKEADRVVFNNSEDAEKAGYKPAKCP